MHDVVLSIKPQITDKSYNIFNEKLTDQFIVKNLKSELYFPQITLKSGINRLQTTRKAVRVPGLGKKELTLILIKKRKDYKRMVEKSKEEIEKE